MKLNYKFILLFCLANSSYLYSQEKDSVEVDVLDEIVITGTQKAVKRSNSPVPVAVYTQSFFKKNPSPSIFEALQHVNGVKPQVNCAVCNTGDIHINGLEGPYTLVLIDGMPIVSGLSTVYGLSGIPNAIIHQVEVVKGPASSLYGSEAVGGLINIITKPVFQSPVLSAEILGSSWGDTQTDFSYAASFGEKARALFGLQHYQYNQTIDKNDDGFTDMPVQNRVAFFQKWDFNRKNQRKFNTMLRYYYEDRWGGQTHWTKADRGGEEVYGESIYTNRVEWLGNYQLPSAEKLNFMWSYSFHDQNSIYGNTAYLAKQHIGFGQLLWDKQFGNNDFLAGLALRYSYYNDNTPATAQAESVTLPGIFVQNQWKLASQHQLLIGARYDYHSVHKNIFTPRLAYKFNYHPKANLRLNVGTGFRVVSLFTEDHAALSGARDVVILEDLQPEKSWNINLNHIRHFDTDNHGRFTLDASLWNTKFSNKIVPDYLTNSEQIIYDNLDGHAISRGASLNLDWVSPYGITLNAGAQLQEVYQKEEGVKQNQLLTEKWALNWAASYQFDSLPLRVDYTGSAYGPMDLPIQGDHDPRPARSKSYSLQNIQVTFQVNAQWELFGGVKNVLNWTPAKDAPFLLANSRDPFDQNVQYDNNGSIVATPQNPYGLHFDTEYLYGTMQGRRAFLGLRYLLN